MSIADSFNKRTIILLIVLAVIGGAVAAYLLYFKDMIAPPTPEPEKIAKRIKIETPVPEEKTVEVKPPVVQTQPPTPPQPEVSSAKPEAVKPAGVKPEVKKEEDVKPAVEKKPLARESASEKKLAARKKKPEPIATAKKAAYKTKTWAVHIASYASREEAESMAKRLRQDRYNAYITEFNMKGKHWYRVRIGFYSSKQVADEVGKKLSSSYNLSGVWVVKPIKKEVMSHLN